MNESGKHVEVYWINSNTRELVLQSKPHIQFGATFSLDSFVGHEFEVREVPGKNGECGDADSDDKTCRVGYFTVNKNADQVLNVNPGIVLKHEDNVSLAKENAMDLMSSCKEKAQNAVNTTSLTSDTAIQTIDDLMECIESNVVRRLKESREEISYQADLRTTMAEALENYTCADERLNTTEPEETQSWEHKGVVRNVKIMHQRPRSKIHLIPNFISEEECEAVEKAAAPILHQASVADGKGGTEFNDHRKAMQAGIPVPWKEEKNGNPIATLSRRVYDYTNRATGFGLEEFGQENLMSIQYFGRGEDDKSPDNYRPHCDGDCTGLKHKHGTRVATMVMYCTIPEKGGTTNFKNAGVHIVPEKGAAVFFSYMGEDKIKDKGFTEHSGCPVLVGEKKIVTQWMRYGVDAENPWNSFNTLGVKKSLEL